MNSAETMYIALLILSKQMKCKLDNLFSFFFSEITDSTKEFLPIMLFYVKKGTGGKSSFQLCENHLK